RLGRVVDEDVEGAGDEVDELHLRDRTHAHEGCPDGRTYDRGLADRGVDDARLAELLEEPLGGAEGAAVGSHLLPDHEHALVALHLLEHGEADRLDVRDLGHYFFSSHSRTRGGTGGSTRRSA